MSVEQSRDERVSSIERGLERVRGRKAKVALAVQGSFGHMMYAQGMLAALQRRGVEAVAASSCVEMMFPVLLYAKGAAIAFDAKADLSNVWLNLWRFTANADPIFDPFSYWKKVSEAHVEIFAGFPDSFFDPFELSGVKETARFVPPGWLKFNPLFIRSISDTLDALMEGTKIPVFTNALNVENFNEVILHTQPLSTEQLERVEGAKGRRDGPRLREVLALNAERFFASGARPPFLAPIEVTLRPHETASGEWEAEHWMEGAMRCNPPLNPLIDVGADVILLLRFFSRDKSIKLMRHQAALLDRYLETMFTAPLEKEIETIEAINCQSARSGGGKREVAVIDPATPTVAGAPNPAHVEALSDLVSRRLDAFSHFNAANLGLRQKVFEEGLEIGDAIADAIF